MSDDIALKKFAYTMAISQLDWYFNDDDGHAAEDSTKEAYQVVRSVVTDAAAKVELPVRREDEPVRPIRCSGGQGRDMQHWLVCGACRHAIDPGDKFCRGCGKAVEQVDD